MLEIIILLVVGCGAGMINAVAGGGNLLVFPAFLALGLSPFSAAITGAMAVAPASTASVFGYRKDLRKIPRAYFYLILPSLFGAGIGLYLLHNTPHSLFDKLVPWLVLVAVVLFVFQPQLHRYLHRPARLRFGSPLAPIAVGLMVACIYGGYFGAGVGFLILVLLGFTGIKSIFQMTGLKSLITACMGVMTVASFSFTGQLNWWYGLITAVGAVVGGYLGARWSKHISPHLVRVVIMSIGMVVVVATFWRVYGG